MQDVILEKRPNLHDSVVTVLREMIVNGSLKAGERINEGQLAPRLGISRTPLREALIRLVEEGALISVPRSGFFVRPLTLKELQHIYPIRALLDPEALRLTGLPSQERLARLEALNRKLVDAQEAEHVVSHDDEWHREILAGCPNPVLVELIEQFIRRTRRYELALMRERRNVLRTVQDHERILAALRVGDLDGACAALRKNMESGKEAIVAWLRDRSTE